MTTTAVPSAAELSELALQMYEQSAHGATVRSGELLTHARRVSRWLAAMASIQTVLVFAIWHTISSRHDVLPVLKLMGLSASLMAGLFWLLWLWSKESPLPPAIAALSIYVTLWWITSAYTFASLQRLFGEEGALERYPLDFSTLVRWVVTIGLLRAVIAGAKHRKLSRQLAAATAAKPAVDPSPAHLLPPIDLLPVEPRRVAGLFSSVALFVVLLYIVLDLIALWGSSELTPVLYQKMVMVNAIIVITWSIACWRDVYRPIARAINPLWYILAIALGGCTFAIAHGWSVLVNSWADLPSPDVSAMVMTDSWSMQLLLIAAAPAVVEEIAFRGIIFGAFARSLKGWENVIVTALMFMVLHASVPSFPHLLLAGLIFGMLRLKTGSWLPGVFMHFTHNFLVMMAGVK